MLEEMLAASKLDAVKATLRGLRNYQNDPLTFANSGKTYCHSSVTLSLFSLEVESIANGSAG